MKRLVLILLAFNCTLSAPLIAKEGETRTARVTKKVSPNDLINIQAKYTDLIIEAWDKNEVEIVATIRYDGKITDKVEDLLNNFQKYVEDNISQSGGELSIETGANQMNRSVKRTLFGLIVEISFNDDNDLRLEYSIKAPAANDYEIENSYRDIRLMGDFNKMKISQYSGELKADFIKEAELNMKYGSATIKGIGEAEMEIYEQEIQSESIKELVLNAKYSELEIDEVKRLDAVSYESDYEIEYAGFLSGNYKYGEIEVREQLEKGEFDFYEMDIRMKSVGSLEFGQSKYGKMDIHQVTTLYFDQSYEDEIEIGRLGSLESKNSKYANYTIKELQKSIELYAYEDEIEIDNVLESATEISIDGKYIDAVFGAEQLSFNLSGKVKYGKVDYNESVVDVKRYIKDSDELEVEVQSKMKKDNPLIIKVNGYEVDVTID